MDGPYQVMNFCLESQNSLEDEVINKVEPRSAILRRFHGKVRFDRLLKIFPLAFWNALVVN